LQLVFKNRLQACLVCGKNILHKELTPR